MRHELVAATLFAAVALTSGCGGSNAREKSANGAIAFVRANDDFTKAQGG